jgi:hypothetical protein
MVRVSKKVSTTSKRSSNGSRLFGGWRGGFEPASRRPSAAAERRCVVAKAIAGGGSSAARKAPVRPRGLPRLLPRELTIEPPLAPRAKAQVTRTANETPAARPVRACARWRSRRSLPRNAGARRASAERSEIAQERQRWATLPHRPGRLSLSRAAENRPRRGEVRRFLDELLAAGQTGATSTWCSTDASSVAYVTRVVGRLDAIGSRVTER